MDRSARVLALLVVSASLAACGGGGSSPAPAAVSGGSAPLSQTVVLVGTRTVTGTGTVSSGLAYGTYGVTETDTGVYATAGLPAGTTFERSRKLVYAAPAMIPVAGIQPQSALVTETDTLATGGAPGITSSVTQTVGEDRSAERSSPGIFTDTRTVTTTYPAPLPATLTPGSAPYPVAAVEHLVENDVSTSGSTNPMVDETRTTNADGSYDESGSISIMNVHAKHVAANFSETSHDQTPGFSLADVTIGVPSALVAGATYPVTTMTQGRTVGNPPIVTTHYMATLASALPASPMTGLYEVVADDAISPSCGLAPGRVAATSAHARRVRYDPGGSLTATDTIVYSDASGLPLCRIDLVDESFLDQTSGAVTGTRNDLSVVARTH